MTRPSDAPPCLMSTALTWVRAPRESNDVDQLVDVELRSRRGSGPCVEQDLSLEEGTRALVAGTLVASARSQPKLPGTEQVPASLRMIGNDEMTDPFGPDQLAKRKLVDDQEAWLRTSGQRPEISQLYGPFFSFSSRRTRRPSSVNSKSGVLTEPERSSTSARRA